jgi:preprotein translocase subunit SecG
VSTPVASRVLIVGLIVAAAIGLAVWLHGYQRTNVNAAFQGTERVTISARGHPAWADPLAVGGVLVAIAVGAAILLVPKKSAG